MNETRNGIPMATDIPQSRRLLACGVGPDSADMHWNHFIIQEPFLCIGEIPCDNETGEVMDAEDVPAWSLLALISILPATVHDGTGNFNRIITDVSEGVWMVEYNSDDDEANLTFTVNRDPFEACVRMVEELHKLKKLS